MTGVLPVVAAAAAGRVLVGCRRGGVVHVAAPGGAGLTPTGRLRRDQRPLCGQRARALRVWPVDGRPLCSRCAARSTDFAFVTLPRAERAALLAQTLHTARTPATWLACRRYCLDLTQHQIDGRRFGELVAETRDRLDADPQRPARMERAIPRRLPAPHVRGRRPDPIDLLVGGTR